MSTDPDRSGRSRTQLLRELARQAEARGLLGTDEDPGVGGRENTTLSRWESEQRGRIRRRLDRWWRKVRSPVTLVAAAALSFFLGLQVALRPEVNELQALQNDADRSRVALQARQGELALVRMEVDRLQKVLEYSRRYRVPADLAADINDIALAEGIAPELAFRLVRMESGFNRRAVSPMGAVGYTQLMPATAFELDPSLEYRDLFDRETNLRLGFRYLRWLIDRYDGDLRIALLAYNRGLGTVDAIRRTGGNPSNGYAQSIMGETH